MPCLRSIVEAVTLYISSLASADPPLYCDEFRVATPLHEIALQRIGDWIYYGGALYADAEIVDEENIRPRRRRRRGGFDPALAELACQDLG